LTPNLSTADEIVTGPQLHPTRAARRPVYLVCATLLAFLLFFAATVGFRTMRAVAFLYEMSPPPRHLPFIKTACLKLFNHEPVLTELSIQGRRGPLQIRMLTPKDLPEAPVILLIHGFAPKGFRDVGMNAFARGLCRSGLRVVIPNIVSESKLQIDSTSVDDVDDAIRWSAKTSGQKVSVVGISFSGGLVITAAAQPDYADFVKMILCVSGYNSIDRLGRYYLHDVVRKPDAQPYPATALPGSLAPMALQYLDELVSPEDVPALSPALRTIMLSRILTDRPPTGLTAKQSVLLDDLLNVRTSAMRQRYHALLERHRATLAYISPAGKIHQVRGSLYVLHGDFDPVIPRGEAEWTQVEAGHKDHVRIVITPWMHHSYMDGPASLAERLRVTYFVVRMLDDGFRHVPLQNAKH
jgi:pimeloyl-ACP methyl ester carboxylesterase